MRTVLTLMLFPALCLAQAPAQPRLVLDSLTHDFGRIAKNAQVSHRFTLANRGGAPLTIGRLNPMCGCTSVVLGKSTLAPGETTLLEVTLNSTGIQGHTSKTVQVFSDDPAQGMVTLTLEAEVPAEVTASTEHLVFLGVRTEDRRKASVKVASATGVPLEILGLELSEAPWLGVATRPDGNDLWVDFDLLARKLPPERASGTDTVTLRLANPDETVVKLSVLWEKLPLVVATPERVAWAEPAGHDLRTTVTLKHREGQPFRIASVRTSSPLLTVPQPSTRAAASHTIQVVLAASASPGTYDERVLVTLDLPGKPEVELRVVAALR